MKRLVAVAVSGALLLTMAGMVSAAPPGVLTARPATIDFHIRSVGTENYKRTKLTNTSGADVLLVVSGGLPDDFGFGLMPGSTCPALAPESLAAGHSCYAVVRFSPTAYFAGSVQRGTLIATAWDPSTGTRLVDFEIPVIGVGSL